MVALGFDKKISKIVLNVIDKTIGKKFPLIDKMTDLFQAQDHKIQAQDHKIRDLELRLDALEHFLKEKEK